MRLPVCRGIEAVVAHEIVRRAAKPVRAGLRDQLHDAPTRRSRFRRILRRADAKLRDRFHADDQAGDAGRRRRLRRWTVIRNELSPPLSKAIARAWHQYSTRTMSCMRRGVPVPTAPA